MSDTVANIIIAVIGSSGFTALVTALIGAHQRRKDRNDAVSKSLNTIEKKLDDHISENEQQFMLQDRARIIAFADECRRKVLHSSEAYDDICRCIDEYGKFCSAHPTFKNSKAETSVSVIKEAHAKCIAENKFI